MLDGKKTYIVALAAILGTIASALSGQIDWPSAANLIVTAILGSTIRDGLTKEMGKR
jgi:uncharacterized membrane protein YfcA